MLKCLSLEFRQCRREYGALSIAILIGFFLLGIGFGFFGFGQGGFKYEALEQLFIIIFTVFSIGIFVVWVVVIVRLFTTYENNMFKVNGYLYNTLPIKSWEMLAAKILFVNIWLMIFSFITILGFFLFGLGTFIMGMVFDARTIIDALRNVMQDFPQFIRALMQVFGNIELKDWFELFVEIIRSLIYSTSLYLIGLFFITFYYTSWIQQLHKIVRVGIGMALVIIAMYVLGNIDLNFDTFTILLTVLGIVSFAATTYLIDHKVDVNC